jgi:hypothetical protein
MSYFSGNAQPRGNHCQPTYPNAIQNHFHSRTYTSSTLLSLGSLPSCKPSSHVLPPHAFPCTPRVHKLVIKLICCLDLPSVPSADEPRYLTEGFETAHPYRPLWVANPPWYGGIPPGGVGSLVGFPFGDIHANIPCEGGLEFPGSIASDQPFNITTNESSSIPPIPTIAAQTPSAASTTPVPPQVQPALPVHKYQCATCLRTFDRESRLENCQNRHSGDKPHKCFGVCGTIGWYDPFFRHGVPWDA